MNRLSVLYVDDDRSNLLAMQYALGDAFDLRVAENGRRALELAEGVDVLVADQRMPGMSGVEVCRRFREVNPGAARILYTAYADAQASVAAINEGEVSLLLVKPVLNEDLLAAILQSNESRGSISQPLEAIAETATVRARHAIDLKLGRSMSTLMGALYDDAHDRSAERELRALVVSLQAGSTSSPIQLEALAATGIPVSGRACAAIDLDSVIHALVLLEPEHIELQEADEVARVSLRASSVARDTMRIASAILERGGVRPVARDGDLILTVPREPDLNADVRVPRIRAPSLDLLIVGDHSAYRESLGDLSVHWTDAESAGRRVHDARVIVVDERRHEATLCHELRRRGATSVVLWTGQLDFARHRLLAGVVDRLVHDGQSPAEQRRILVECVEKERRADAERSELVQRIRETVEPALAHARQLAERLASRAAPLLTSRALRDAWRSCEARAWPST